MKELKVYFLMGPTDCNDPNIPRYSDEFLAQLSEACGFKVSNGSIDEVAAQELPVFFIASGGAEQAFQRVYEKAAAPYILLTTPAYNSLAAAMEIFEFLAERGQSAEILHGSYEHIARRLSVLLRSASAVKKVRGMRLGAIGKPSGLIASEADAAKLRKACGMELMDIDLMELVAEYEKGGYPESAYTQALLEKGWSRAETEKALNVYGAAKRLIDKYSLSAVTIRCFDLLTLIGTTGCLALAILNAEGIPAACEGDTKTLVAMCVAQSVTGLSSFMANPSCMDPDKSEIIFAHCTLPADMPDSYTLTTHFESGIGVALSGDMQPCDMTVFKCSDSLERWYAGRAKLLETPHRADLCRSQMRLWLADGTGYFERGPIGNHHLIIKGDWSEELNEFFRMIHM